MKNENIRTLWKKFIIKYQEYFLDNETQWKNSLNKVKEYINENKKKPPEKDKNKEIKTLGKWISKQHTNYKKKEK